MGKVTGYILRNFRINYLDRIPKREFIYSQKMKIQRLQWME